MGKNRNSSALTPLALQHVAARTPTKRSSRRAPPKSKLERQPSTDLAAGKRSSIYRGVTRHRWTGRYEAHLWDKSCWNDKQHKKGKQVYLGAYDEEEAAARAYDLAALKYWGPGTLINFTLEHYGPQLKEMQKITREEYLATLRRQSSGFSRGVSKYRGVARHHHNGRWEARIGRVFGNKYLYLGTYSTQEEAAAAYDIAAIRYRGGAAVTNFELNRYPEVIQSMQEEQEQNRFMLQEAGKCPLQDFGSSNDLQMLEKMSRPLACANAYLPSTQMTTQMASTWPQAQLVQENFQCSSGSLPNDNMDKMAGFVSSFSNMGGAMTPSSTRDSLAPLSTDDTFTLEDFSDMAETSGTSSDLTTLAVKEEHEFSNGIYKDPALDFVTSATSQTDSESELLDVNFLTDGFFASEYFPLSACVPSEVEQESFLSDPDICEAGLSFGLTTCA